MLYPLGPDALFCIVKDDIDVNSICRSPERDGCEEPNPSQHCSDKRQETGTDFSEGDLQGIYIMYGLNQKEGDKTKRRGFRFL